MNLKGQSNEKVCEIIPLNDRLSSNLGAATVFKILKSPVEKRRYYKQTLEAKLIYLSVAHAVHARLGSDSGPSNSGIPLSIS
jgi:hypothetical protein